ncbi:MAG: ketopantoate reductase family protein [Lachnospiraceae bacterium]|nr:ketopantoate reductase family protein [Lachnospiraceae bacterium]
MQFFSTVHTSSEKEWFNEDCDHRPRCDGLLYGAKLSTAAEVVLVGRTAAQVDAINEHGVTVKRDGQEIVYPVPAILSGTAADPVDLVILFTKAYATEAALEQNRQLIGSRTMLLTLQNGAGHEEILRKFVDESRVLIGTTMQGSGRENSHAIVHSGLGDTNIGSFAESFDGQEQIKAVFEQAGFPLNISSNIRQVVWEKLVVNASSSVLSGVLNVPQGFLAESESAWELCQELVREVCRAAESEGCHLDPAFQIERVRNNLVHAPQGVPSITADLRNGRKTEVDFISGAVVRAAHKNKIEVPVQETMVRLVHAMEARN